MRAFLRFLFMVLMPFQYYEDKRMAAEYLKHHSERK